MAMSMATWQHKSIKESIESTVFINHIMCMHEPNIDLNCAPLHKDLRTKFNDHVDQNRCYHLPLAGFRLPSGVDR